MPSNLPDGFIQYAEEWEAKINAFTDLDFQGAGTPAAARGEAGDLVAGLPFAVKDNIAAEGRLFTCGSKMLINFRPPYSATAVEKLKEAGGFVLGKTNLDEFGAGFSTRNSAVKKTENPWRPGLPPGCGAAAAVACGIAPYALGSDTNGSARLGAAFCGITALKPTYGAVSRWGLAAYASSFDTVSVLADSARRCRAVFSIIRGKDPKDGNSKNAPHGSPPLYPQAEKSAKKIAVLSAASMSASLEAVYKGAGKLPEAVLKALEAESAGGGFELAKERLKGLGHSLTEIEIPAAGFAFAAYLAISLAQASANLARFNGIRFGSRPQGAKTPDELVDLARKEGFCLETKKSAVLGTYLLSAGVQELYYQRAMGAKAALLENLEVLLGDGLWEKQAEFDAILMPAAPQAAVAAASKQGASMLEGQIPGIFCCAANLSGLPAVSFAAGLQDGLPFAAQLVGRAFSEGGLLDIAQGYQEAHPAPAPSGFKAFWR